MPQIGFRYMRKFVHSRRSEKAFEAERACLDELPTIGVERERLRPTSWSDYGARVPREYAPREDVPDLSTGDAVRHQSLGTGIVTRIEPGNVVTVRFEDGSERRLMLEYAPLERLG